MTDAKLGYGTKLKMSDMATPTPVFSEIGEIKDGPNDEDSVDLVEVTNHQSPGKRREYIGGLIDGGEVTFTVNYIPDNPTHDRSTGLQAKIGQNIDFRLEEPGMLQGFGFAAIVMNCSRSYPVAEAMEMQVTIKKTGDVTPYVIVP